MMAVVMGGRVDLPLHCPSFGCRRRRDFCLCTGQASIWLRPAPAHYVASGSYGLAASTSMCSYRQGKLRNMRPDRCSSCGPVSSGWMDGWMDVPPPLSAHPPLHHETNREGLGCYATGLYGRGLFPIVCLFFAFGHFFPASFSGGQHLRPFLLGRDTCHLFVYLWSAPVAVLWWACLASFKKNSHAATAGRWRYTTPWRWLEAGNGKK